MNVVLAIDPGTSQSAWVRFEDGVVKGAGITSNCRMVALIEREDPCELVVEMIASYGMPVGKEVFATCVWIGRFIETGSRLGAALNQMYRNDVKLHLCGGTRANDANIRQRLIDIYGPTKAVAVGLKKTPGPLYGFKRDMWAALAVGVTHINKKEKEE